MPPRKAAPAAGAADAEPRRSGRISAQPKEEVQEKKPRAPSKKRKAVDAGEKASAKKVRFLAFSLGYKRQNSHLIVFYPFLFLADET